MKWVIRLIIIWHNVEWGKKMDRINKPNHYNIGDIEVIDFIDSWSLNFNLGNVIKYVIRCNYKENKVEDLQKAIYYIEREINRG